jgi:hypothetical protein
MFHFYVYRWFEEKLKIILYDDKIRKIKLMKPACSSESIFISDLTDDFVTGVEVVLNDDIPPVVNRLSIGSKFDWDFSLRILFSIELNTRDDWGVVSIDESLRVLDEPSLVLASSSSAND